MGFTYDPKKTSECWPEGEYRATLKKVEDTTSKNSGNNMTVVTFEVHNNDRTMSIRDYLVEGYAWANAKYKYIAQALGRGEEFIAGQFDAANYIGNNVMLVLSIEDSDQYGEQNRIKKYIPSDKKAEPSQKPQAPGDLKPVTDDEIPF